MYRSEIARFLLESGKAPSEEQVNRHLRYPILWNFRIKAQGWALNMFEDVRARENQMVAPWQLTPVLGESQ